MQNPKRLINVTKCCGVYAVNYRGELWCSNCGKFYPPFYTKGEYDNRKAPVQKEAILTFHPEPKKTVTKWEDRKKRLDALFAKFKNHGKRV